jgi:divalent metal cation (Fe/Co/Zn/Cd) transporter
MIAIVLVIEMKGLLIGESATRKDVEAIRAAIEVEPDVLRIIHMKTEHIGPDELLVGAKVEFLHELTVAEVAATIDRIERTIRTGVPVARVIYLEPDVFHEHRATGFVEEHTGRSDPVLGIDDDDIWTDS